jgi:hypothetical protein
VSERRFRDPTTWLYDLAADDVDVVCPRCAGRAIVAAQRLEGRGTLDWPRRLTCPSCAYAALWAAQTRGSVWGGPVDPFFRRPLWLRTRWRAHIVWAFNRRHLEILEGFVGADLRERGPGGRSSTMISQLPAWMKSAKNRKGLLVALGRLRRKLDP